MGVPGDFEASLAPGRSPLRICWMDGWMDGWKGWIFQTDSALLPLTLDPRLILDCLDLLWKNYLCILATTLSQGLQKALWDCS